MSRKTNTRAIFDFFRTARLRIQVAILPSILSKNFERKKLSFETLMGDFKQKFWQNNAFEQEETILNCKFSPLGLQDFASQPRDFQNWSINSRSVFEDRMISKATLVEHVQPIVLEREALNNRKLHHELYFLEFYTDQGSKQRTKCNIPLSGFFLQLYSCLLKLWWRKINQIFRRKLSLDIGKYEN